MAYIYFQGNICVENQRISRIIELNSFNETPFLKREKKMKKYQMSFI